jgi:hypothetical protein
VTRRVRYVRSAQSGTHIEPLHQIAITTIDHLSNGRTELGIGAGWSQVEYEVYGTAFPSADSELRDRRWAALG